MRHLYLLAYTSSKLKQLGMMNSSDDWLQAYYAKLYSPDYYGFRAAKYSINELIKITSENKIKLLIVNIPDLRRLKEYPFGFATELPKGLTEANSIPFLDLYSSFENHDEQSLWVSPEDPHMSKKANQLTAEAITNKITI